MKGRNVTELEIMLSTSLGLFMFRQASLILKYYNVLFRKMKKSIIQAGENFYVFQNTIMCCLGK